MNTDGATLYPNRLSSPEYSIKSLAVCFDCPRRWAITAMWGAFRLEELGEFWSVYQCAQDPRSQMVCPRCTGTMKIYVLEAAQVADGRYIVLDNDMSASYVVFDSGWRSMQGMN